VVESDQRKLLWPWMLVVAERKLELDAAAAHSVGNRGRGSFAILHSAHVKGNMVMGALVGPAHWAVTTPLTLIQERLLHIGSLSVGGQGSKGLGGDSSQVACQVIVYR
jgi:hypothetical protein